MKRNLQLKSGWSILLQSVAGASRSGLGMLLFPSTSVIWRGFWC